MSPATDQTQCLERMCDVFSANEDRLVKRVMFRVGELGLRSRPRSEESWHESVRGLSDVLFQAIYVLPDSEAERSDPIRAFGVLRARTHQLRGVRPADWTRLFRIYREAYVDLLRTADCDEVSLERCREFVTEVFDRFEDGFRHEYRVREARAE